MSLLDGYREGDAYLQVRPDPHYRGELRVVKSTQNRPAVTEPGCTVVKIKIRMPKAAFEPLQPEAVVTIPESLVQQRPIEVEAVDPS